MIYVMSDIHGKYDKYIQMLKQIHFSEKDTMYILGDMIDRGEKGMELLIDLTGVRQLKINKCSECGLIAAFFVSSLFIYLLYGCCMALYFMV